MIGRKIGHFQIISELGTGGMGTVYKALDLKLNRHVAIKALRQYLLKDDTSFKRFQNEAQASALINHPNVATLYDFLEVGEESFIVMEYVEGMTLEDLIQNAGKIPKNKTIEITCQILKGLGAAHAKGILHRDLKPSNIMINNDGYVKIMDFGIALMENSTRLTTVNKIIGSIYYLAPELITGAIPTKGSDLYSVGIIMHEMLTGLVMHEAESQVALMYQIVHEQPRINLSAKFSDLSFVIEKLIDKDLEHRISDSSTALTAILSTTKDSHAGQTVSARKQGLLQKAKSGFTPGLIPSRKSVLLAGLSLIGIFLLIGTSRFWYKSSNELAFSTGNHIPDSEKLVVQYEPIKGPDAQNRKHLLGDSSAGPRKIDISSKKSDVKPIATKKSTVLSNESKSGGSPKTSPLDPLKTSTRKKTKEDSMATTPSTNLYPPKEQTLAIEKKASDQEPVARVVSELPTKTEELGTSTIVKTLSIPQQKVALVFNKRISSQDYSLGETVMLEIDHEVRLQNHLLINERAPVKAVVKRKKESRNGKLKFGIQFQEVQAINGAWLRLKYPEYTDIQDGEVVFQKGRKVGRVILTSSKINIEI